MKGPVAHQSLELAGTSDARCAVTTGTNTRVKEIEHAELGELVSCKMAQPRLMQSLILITARSAFPAMPYRCTVRCHLQTLVRQARQAQHGEVSTWTRSRHRDVQVSGSAHDSTRYNQTCS